MRRLLPLPSASLEVSGTEGDPVDGALDALYHHPLPPSGAHLRVNVVTSTDGAAAVGGSSRPLSSAADRTVMRTLRGLADVLLVAGGTARAERYGPLRPSAARRAARRAAGMAEVPPVAVVTRSLDLDPSSPLFTGGEVRPLVLTCDAADPDRRRALAAVADVVVAGGETVDPARAVDALRERGLRRVLCEGGPDLAGQLLAGDLVDELCLTVAPVAAGPGLPGVVAGAPLDAPRTLRLAHVLEEDGSLLLRYERAGRDARTS